MPARTPSIQAATRSLRRAPSAPASKRSVALVSSSSLRPHFPSSSSLPSPRTLTASFSTTPLRSAEPIPPRRSEYKKLDHSDVSHFRSILSSPSSIVTTISSPSNEWTPCTADDLTGYNTDWMDKYQGNSSILLKPKNTKEVSEIIKYCYDKRIAVIPQGGNTGLVGGGVPVYDELILSTEGMNGIREFDEVSGQFRSPTSALAH